VGLGVSFKGAAFLASAAGGFALASTAFLGGRPLLRGAVLGVVLGVAAFFAVAFVFVVLRFGGVSVVVFFDFAMGQKY
jgi:hypothetical protein